MHNDAGREIGVLGMRLQEDELKAPAGQFRVVTIDGVPLMAGFASRGLWLRFDTADRKEAEEFAQLDDQGLYTGTQIYDHVGTALLV